jgi:hypothetical protein
LILSLRSELSNASKNKALFRKPEKNGINAPIDFKGPSRAVANLLTAERLRELLHYDLAHLWMTGEWPEGDLDHANLDRADDPLEQSSGKPRA